MSRSTCHSLAQQMPLSFLVSVFPLTWISAATVLVSEQMVAFLPRLEVFDSLLKELLWRQPQITVALEATLSSPVCPPGSRHRSILKHRLSNFCSLASSACSLTLTLLL